MKSAIRSCLNAAAILGCISAANADPRPVVVELFTSQGCSSCPPADAYVGKLSARPDVLALAFHVDYWDSLGWRDRFALPQSVERQNIYARNLRRSTVYTPQLVIDGRDDQVGTDGRAVTKALSANREGVPVGLSVHNAEVKVEVGTHLADPAHPDAAHPVAEHGDGASRVPSTSSDVILVSYLHHAVSAVGRGENSGRTLEEFNIVRDIRTLGEWNGQLASFHVPVSSIPTDATDVAVLVQPRGQAPIIGAGTRALR